MTEIPNVKIDVHTHLTGVGCCNSGCWVSDDFKQRYTFKAIKWLQKITKEQMETSIDKDWAKKISEYVAGSEVDFAVALGFDGAYKEEDGSMDPHKSQMIVPPKWVFEVCHRHKNLLPGPSINPFKKNALEELAYCIEQKACLIKWIPTAQDIDPSSTRIKEFYETLLKHNIPLLVHTGGEKTFKEVSAHYNDLTLLEYPIELGVKVIFAHCAAHTINPKEPNHQKKQMELLEQHENIWVDNSGICNPSRFFHLPNLFKNEKLMERMLYGSDWPVPSNSFYYPKLGIQKIMELESIKNPIQRDIAIKKTFDMPEKTFYLANKVLANVSYWVNLSQKKE